MLLLLRQRHVVQADLTLVLLAMTGARCVIHETVVSDLGQVLSLLFSHLAASRLTNSMNVLLLIVVHVRMVARLVRNLRLACAASLLDRAVLSIEVVLELDRLRHALLEVRRAATYVGVAISSASCERRVSVYSGADRSISHHLTTGICVFRVQASANAALEHLIP